MHDLSGDDWDDLKGAKSDTKADSSQGAMDGDGNDCTDAVLNQNKAASHAVNASLTSFSTADEGASENDLIAGVVIRSAGQSVTAATTTNAAAAAATAAADDDDAEIVGGGEVDSAGGGGGSFGRAKPDEPWGIIGNAEEEMWRVVGDRRGNSSTQQPLPRGKEFSQSQQVVVVSYS